VAAIAGAKPGQTKDYQKNLKEIRNRIADSGKTIGT
tara:strand:- start:1152 stop:1259 length:108 start_codon:yes stop_codon:yes gene_type:complete